MIQAPLIAVPLIVVLAAAAAFAQTSRRETQIASSKVPAASTTPSGHKLALNSGSPVITIHGVCDSPKRTNKAGQCTTVVSKDQFETVLGVVKSTSRSVMPPVPLSVAEGYSELLMYAEAAKRAGAEKDPRFEQVLEVTKLRALGDMYRRQLDEQAQRISPQEIEAYYKKNTASFEEIHLRRVILPRNNKANLQDLVYRERAKRLAKELRERAAKGEDVNKLQHEACAALGFKDEQGTLMVPLRRGMLDAKVQQELFALNAGRVSTLMDNPGVYVFYKLEGRKMLTLDEVKEEILRTLYRQKLEALTKAVTESVKVDYNRDYFGVAPNSNWIAAGALGNSSSQKSSPAPPR